MKFDLNQKFFKQKLVLKMLIECCFNNFRQLMFKENSEPSMSRGKRFTSNIPRPVKLTKSAIDKTTNYVSSDFRRVFY